MRSMQKLVWSCGILLMFSLVLIGCGGGGGGGGGGETEEPALTVTLNQIDASGCPTIKAYVSVTDQNDILFEGLAAADFTVTENGGAPVTLSTSEPVQPNELPLATAIVMDYSWSVAGDPTNVALFEALKDGAKWYVNEIRDNDLASIIKFATTNEVSQDFTSDKALLVAAIDDVPVGLGTKTLLYDTLYLAITNIALQPVDRRAVIIFTDGRDYDTDYDDPLSIRTKAEVIALAQANDVPIFTIKAGQDADPPSLRQMANETGGQYFDATTTNRLITIYERLSEILNGQYVLTYDTGLTGAPVTVRVAVDEQQGLLGDTSNPLEYDGCIP